MIFKLRVESPWWLQSLADWFWERKLIKFGHAACRLGGMVYPQSCKDDPTQWGGFPK